MCCQDKVPSSPLTSLVSATSPAFEPVFGTRTVALSQSLSLGLDALVCRACRCDCPGLPLCDPPPPPPLPQALAPRPPPLVRAERSSAPRGSRDPCARGKAPCPCASNSAGSQLAAQSFLRRNPVVIRPSRPDPAQRPAPRSRTLSAVATGSAGSRSRAMPGSEWLCCEPTVQTPCLPAAPVPVIRPPILLWLLFLWYALRT